MTLCVCVYSLFLPLFTLFFMQPILSLQAAASLFLFYFTIFKFFEIKDKTLQGRNEKNTQITLHHRRLQSLNAMLTLVKERKKKRFKFFAFWLRERKYLSTICYQDIRENIFTDEMNDNPRYILLSTHLCLSNVQLLFLLTARRGRKKRKRKNRWFIVDSYHGQLV